MKTTNLHRSRRLLPLLAIAVAAGGIGFGSLLIAQDEISKSLLIKLSRDQSQVLCSSETFTQCMGFSETQCLDLSEKALQECLVPLPDPVKLSELKNDQLERCPQEVYTEAGYSDEKAVECLHKAMGE